ncbi:hypothetical protein [Tumebacillus flagellatus]|uniref:hypothetical protein n=1 Tax=Tumebacillus flagellatus TaxID=1157490 RepID=UPI0012691DA8|nr:hypothetical protein [Tumebacillus flagellatus]
MNPLFPDRDGPQIVELLKEIREAKPVKDDNLIFPTHAFPSTVTIVRKDGTKTYVDFAYSCQSPSSTQTTCKSVPDHVLIQTSDSADAYPALSPKLYEYVDHMSRTWPDVPLLIVPDSACLGRERKIQVEGNEWLTDRVNVRLKQGENVLLTLIAHPKDGHFNLPLEFPSSLAPGDYSLEIEGEGWTTTSREIKLTD